MFEVDGSVRQQASSAILGKKIKLKTYLALKTICYHCFLRDGEWKYCCKCVRLRIFTVHNTDLVIFALLCLLYRNKETITTWSYDFGFTTDNGLSLASLIPEPPTCHVYATYGSCEKQYAASPIRRVAAGVCLPAIHETNSSHFAQSC